uniref:LYR motif-containing protein 2 n=1 Tax=Pygocentrus nattereri TaxID=42514 RepID=A0AAR2M318_PYGNA
MSRLPTTALNLKQFLQRQRVLGLYRSMLRTIRLVPDEADRKYLRDWAREEFKRNKEATNQVQIGHEASRVGMRACAVPWFFLSCTNRFLEQLKGSENTGNILCREELVNLT